MLQRRHLSGCVVDDKPVLDVQAGRLGERTKLPVSKDVPSRRAAHVLYIPGDHDIAIGLVPPQTIVQKAQGGWNRAVVAHVIAVMHVHEDPALGRHQTRKLTENLHAAGGGKDMSEDIPETRDDVKLGLGQVKFFGAHGPDCGVRATCIATLGSTRTSSAMSSGLCDPAGSHGRRPIRHRAWSGFQAVSRRSPADRCCPDTICAFRRCARIRVRSDRTRRRGLTSTDTGWVASHRTRTRGAPQSGAPHLRAMGGRRSAHRSAGPRRVWPQRTTAAGQPVRLWVIV